jgi:hypothetical protein
MLQNLTRGLGVLTEAEFAARRDAEQMAKALVGLREALTKVEAIHEENWTQENFGVELTRGMTAVDNARMEWNAARLKFDVLSDGKIEQAKTGPATVSEEPLLLANCSFGKLCRMGFALTWPVAAVILIGFLLLAGLHWRR